jgi:hypothetical protein
VTDRGHIRNIVVWDVPGAIPCGAVFTLRAGIKCVAGCPPDRWSFEIHDQDGATLASAPVADQPWPGTTGLFTAQFELRAPDQAGLAVWHVQAPATPGRAAGEDLRHDAAAAQFNVRTVPAAECRLTVLAIDRAAQEPVAGLKVVAHPYRAMTDERGVAELFLPKGHYRLFVTGRDFFPLRLDGELQSDQEIRAELEVDRGPSDAELWS